MLRITAYADRLLADLDLLDWTESDQADAAQLDRPQHRAPTSCSRSRSTRASRSRSSRPGPTRSSARPTWCSRPSTRSSTRSSRRSGRSTIAGDVESGRRLAGHLRHDRRPPRRCARYREFAGVEDRPRAPVGGSREDGRVHRRVREQPDQRLRRSRSSSPTTCSWATAPARSWPSPRTTHATSSSPASSSCRSMRVVRPPDAWLANAASRPTRRPSEWPEAYVGDGVAMNSTNDEVSLDGLETAEAKQRHRRVARARRTRRADRHLQAARLAVQPPALLGRAVPDRVRRRRSARSRCRSRCCRSSCPSSPTSSRASSPTTTPRRARAAARARRELGERRARSRDGPRAPYRRETNTMPQWAGSCWYYLRYLDPTNENELVDPAVERYWMAGAASDPTGSEGGVDLYVGGVEHAVLHLFTRGSGTRCCSTSATCRRPSRSSGSYNQGMIQAYAFVDARGVYVEASEVVERDGAYWFDDEPVTREYGKMGKSLKNVVTPDDIYRDYGADTLRLYEMFMGPLDASRPWSTADITGVHRFLQRLWRNIVDEDTGALARHRRSRRRRDASRAAPDDRGGARRHGGAEVQHRDRPPVRAEQPSDPGRDGGRRRAARSGRAARPDARATDAAHRRGAVAASGPRRIARVRALPRSRPACTSWSTRWRSRYRSTARCARR